VSILSRRTEFRESNVFGNVLEYHLDRHTNPNMFGRYLDIGHDSRAFIEVDYRDHVWDICCEGPIRRPLDYACR